MSARGLDEHCELRDAMARFAVLMGDPCDANLALLPRERMLFSRLFSRHLADERSALAANAASPKGAVTPALLREYDGRVAALRSDYSAHVNGWVPARIAAEWADYVSAVRSLQARLRDLMAWEEGTLPTLQ